MNTILENIKTSIEFYLLVLVCACFLYNANLTLRPDPSFVHRFENYKELSINLIECSDHSQPGKLYSTSRTAKPEQSACLIEEEEEDDNGTKSRHLPFNDLEIVNYSHIEMGGYFKPSRCSTKQKVALVIPYRDRSEHLERLTLYIHRFLPEQSVDYTVYVVEQTAGKPFNRAKLFNVGVTEILKLRNDTCCFIFHDVDLLPLDRRNLYMCSYRPRHMSPSVNSLRFNLLYPELFGGVIAVTKEQFESIGGFSNRFYGWGGEDDDIFERFRVAGYGIDRTPLDIGVYAMMKHPKMKPNPSRRQLIGSPVDQSEPNSSRYSLEVIEKLPLYTRILVSL